MKKIEAIIQPFKLDEVKEALAGIGVDGMSEELLTTLTTAARTGKIGDGKIFVYDVAEAIRIRNDDRGDAAL
ncbi:MAG: P-II family nitrogen regulator [Bryobacteraceae bacterium]